MNGVRMGHVSGIICSALLRVGQYITPPVDLLAHAANSCWFLTELELRLVALDVFCCS